MQTAPRIEPSKHRVVSRLGPYSKLGATALVDGRSKEALFMKRVRNELVEHLGGKPNAAQRMLVERAVRLSLALELLDEKLMHGGTFTTHDDNHYIAWHNALTRTLARLGLNAVSNATHGPSYDDYLTSLASNEDHAK